MIQQNELPPAEGGRGFSFVVLAYRCAMAELSGAREPHRIGVWDVLETVAPFGEAEALFGCFFGFARALLGATERPIEWRSAYCANLCRDEWLAVSMIDAAQRADVAGLLGFASELIGVEALGDALDATQSLAAALSRRGLAVRPESSRICAEDLSPRRTLH